MPALALRCFMATMKSPLNVISTDTLLTLQLTLLLLLLVACSPTSCRPPCRLPPPATMPAQLLVSEGLIQGIGLSEISADEVRRAHAVHPIAALELEWSLFTRDCEVWTVWAVWEWGRKGRVVQEG